MKKILFTLALAAVAFGSVISGSASIHARVCSVCARSAERRMTEERERPSPARSSRTRRPVSS